MPFNIINKGVPYDVCIVGSGAGGGMAAKTLSEAGLKICIIEAGPDFDPAKPEHQTQLKWPYESPRRGARTGTRGAGDFDAAYGHWNIEGEPYTKHKGTEFSWFRSRMIGGRTNHWGRMSLRFGPIDFKHKSFDGLGDDWPISYDDVRPYYDRLDKMVGIFGTKEGLHNEPDGYFLPPPLPRLHELMIKKAADKLAIPVIPSRLSILTRPINKSRGSCFYCNQCNRGCLAYADFSSSSVLIQPAKKTGNVDIFVNAMAREILTNKQGKASGVLYTDKNDLQNYQVNAKVIVLAASACESARLLLNSKSTYHPNGLGNSSGVVGKYLHDSTGSSRSAIVPSLINRKRYNEDGVGGVGMHLYIPWWLDNKKLNFPRGYHIEFGGGMEMPTFGFGFDIEKANATIPGKEGTKSARGGYGLALKEANKSYYGASVTLSGRGESIPREENICEIDPDVVDKYGIPVLRFKYEWTDYELKQAAHMHDTFEQIFDKMGATPKGKKPGEVDKFGLAKPGGISHEVGTTRMGNDPKSSVLNKFSQVHNCKNVFVVDGGSFVSQADKNPTWTILALSLRASDFIIDELKRQNL